MKAVKKSIFIFCLIFNFLIIYSQQTLKISGYVKDSTSNEAMIGATAFNTHTEKGTVTNNFGYFSMQMPINARTIVFSFVGYAPRQIVFTNTTDTVVDIYLSQGKLLNEVTITGNANAQLLTTQTSMEKITAKTVNALPVILGESDLLRIIQLLPGVSMGTENSLGFNVRGGSNDQNLILIDGVPIYSAYHLYGLFSIINTDAINDAKLYKGGFPARYGGRLSSILDVQMREGNANKFSGELGLGIAASKFTFEGPIAKGKTSFIVTGRRSMTDILPKFLYQSGTGISEHTGLAKSSRDINLPSYYFYDINTKLNHSFSKNSRLFVNFYNGRDDYDNSRKQSQGYSDHILKNWGNTLASVRWNLIFPNSLFANFMFYYTKYYYFTQDDNQSTNSLSTQYLISYGSEIADYSAKADFGYNFQNHSLKFGLQYSKQKIVPGVTAFKADFTTLVDTTYNFEEKANIFSVYFEDLYTITDNLSLNAGAHLSGYYVENTLHSAFQPRISGNYRLADNKTVKVSYARMVQNIHQLSQTINGSPADLWMPSTKRIKPSYSDVFAIGYHHVLNSSVSFTVEAFRKNLYNLVTYKEGASYMTDATDWQDMVETGTGKSFGLELSLNKEIGKTTGWISYTWSRSTRRFENVNSGREFPFTFDRTHNIAIALMQRLGKKIDLGADWVYYTGNAITLSNSKVFYHAGISVFSGNIHQSVNGYRMPPYHRLDLSMSYNGSIKKNIKTKLTIGAYNAYNRANPYYMKFDDFGVFTMSLYGLLPYINYSIKF